MLYSLDHQDMLYRAVTAFSMALNIFSFIGFLRVFTVVNFNEHLFSYDGLPILYPLATLPLAIVFAWISRRELKEMRQQGITAFAMLLCLEILNGRVLVVVAGLYAIFNRSFREAREGCMPAWYQKLLQSF